MFEPIRPEPLFKIGDRVRTYRYGPGTVTAIRGPHYLAAVDQWMPASYTILFQGRGRITRAQGGFAENSIWFDCGYTGAEHKDS